MGHTVQSRRRASTLSSPTLSHTNGSVSFLHDQRGNRKYLVVAEREAFLRTTRQKAPSPGVQTFCSVLAYTGARLSEALALTARQVDFEARVLVIRSLKKRGHIIYRTVPVPQSLLDDLEAVHGIRSAQNDPSRIDERLWGWCRTTAWAHVKEMMTLAGIRGPQATAKGLRHGFAIACLYSEVPLTLVSRWLGHARLETTVVYTNAVGKEERDFAQKLWGSFDTGRRLR